MTEDTVGFLRRENSNLRMEVEHLREEAEYYRLVANALKEREEFSALLMEERFPQGPRMSIVLQKLTAVTDEVIDAEVKAGCVDQFRNVRDVAVAACKMLRVAPRTVEGDGNDLPVGTVVIDRGGHPLMKADDEWNIARFDDYTPSLTENNRAPYTIVWTPEENTNE